ncbi:NADP-dependent oxidoreductase [Actinacidiphila rubida]|uniref:NADPH:quinone reductase n=1 Tax=Actinacidiphila rubida TaxID=310780 RepID=A0A1H8IYG5_9ACTN|nr:NADP-dependent oxidoreductase [Actinacidiphila rubida]SEN73643.1 NADPH:quinone reductase [Actinacidiphila rubida]
MPRAYVYNRFGGPEAEAFADLPRPVPGPGQLLVAVRASGVNPADWKRREGMAAPGEPAPRFPRVFGREAAGVVAEVGEGVTGFAVGDEVFGHPVAGSYAQFTLLPEGAAAVKPAAVSFADAATLPVAGGTAWDGLRQLDLPRGATLLVNGAGGGVGSAAVQIAVHDGLRVIGTAGAAKADFVTSLGAAHVASGPGVADRVRAVAPDGVDAVFDLVGGEPLRAVAALAADPRRVISVADKAGVAELGGSAVTRARTTRALEAVVALVAEGALDPFVTRTFPLDQADRALRAVEDGHTRGKVVIEVSADRP